MRRPEVGGHVLIQRITLAAITAAILYACSLAATATVIAKPPACSPSCVERVKTRALADARAAQVRAWQREWRAAPAPVRAHLRRIAWCESRDDEHAVSPDGRYRGLLQFAWSTWVAMGGRGDPATAPRWEQWARGARLYKQAGPGQWPVCQYR